MASTPKSDETTDEMMARNSGVRGSTVDEAASRKDPPRVRTVDEHMQRGSADQHRGTARRR
jgi:hypothetical protein